MEAAQKQIAIMPQEAHPYACWHCAQYHITRGIETPTKKCIRESIDPPTLKRIVTTIRQGESIPLGGDTVPSGVGPIRVSVHYVEGCLVGYHSNNDSAPVAWIFEKHDTDMTGHYKALEVIGIKIRRDNSVPIERVSKKIGIHVVKYKGAHYTVAYHRGKKNDAESVEILHRQPIE